jgi:hypothetical protein
MVLFSIGTNAWDATCTIFGLPHMIVGSLPMSSERIFSSGNERTMAIFNPPVIHQFHCSNLLETKLTDNTFP